MQISSVSFNIPKKVQPAFNAKIDSKLMYYAKKDPRYDEFMKQFSHWGDSHSVVGIYNTKINGKTRYMLRLRNEVLGRDSVAITRDEPEYMESKLASKFFNLTSKNIDFAEYKLFRDTKKDAISAGFPYVAQLNSIIKSNKEKGIEFDADTMKRFINA